MTAWQLIVISCRIKSSLSPQAPQTQLQVSLEFPSQSLRTQVFLGLIWWYCHNKCFALNSKCLFIQPQPPLMQTPSETSHFHQTQAFDLLDLKTLREANISLMWDLGMASAYRSFFSTLCRARNTDLGRHPTEGARRFGHVSWQNWFLGQDWHELVAHGGQQVNWSERERHGNRYGVRRGRTRQTEHEGQSNCEVGVEVGRWRRMW